MFSSEGNNSPAITTNNDLAILIQQQNALIQKQLEEWKLNINDTIENSHKDLSSQITGLYTAVDKQFTTIENKLTVQEARIDSLERQRCNVSWNSSYER